MATKRGTGHQHGPSQRQLRVGEEIRHELADLLRRGDFRDPELASLNVTVTEVRISPDLRNATAFVTPLGGSGAEAAVKALKRAAPFLRGQIARSMRLRMAPNLFFEADTSFDYASHINDLLHDPAVQRDLRDGPPAGSDTEAEDAGADEDGADGGGADGGRGDKLGP
ncbi:30S ribosome-binding factor RbfA [Arenibaculum pallidiluteum]|uniref:30S ribosome-binding factor RbfA n=1 Tax=Arenibaculum pallidiluteum TaxID=2812559 RepID=UPI001A97BA39|nr:30S ribosome-binding factor RbfA [Arenibaculum pallidiluteum]